MINALDKRGLARGNRTRFVRTNDIARTPIEVSTEGSSTLISHLPSALIINHQSVLNSHPVPTVSSVHKGQLGQGGDPSTRCRAHSKRHLSRACARATFCRRSAPLRS